MAGNFSGLATREIYQKILDFIYLALVPLLVYRTHPGTFGTIATWRSCCCNKCGI